MVDPNPDTHLSPWMVKHISSGVAIPEMSIAHVSNSIIMMMAMPPNDNDNWKWRVVWWWRGI
jgi:hypothetical protein